MRLEIRECEICLADNRPLRLSSAAGLRVVCTAGMVWLTEEGEPGDIILSPGQSHELGSAGLALAEALGEGRVRLLPPAGLLSRMKRFAAGLLAESCPL